MKKKRGMRGETYMRYKNKMSSATENTVQRTGRRLGPRCLSKYCMTASNCHCSDISEEEEKEMFENFWTLLDWNQRKTSVTSLVYYIPAKTGESGGSRRGGSFKYHLRMKGNKMAVCQVTFLSTFGLNE